MIIFIGVKFEKDESFGKVLPEREDLRRVTPHSGGSSKRWGFGHFHILRPVNDNFYWRKIREGRVLRKSPPGEGGFEEGDAPFRGLLEEVGVWTLPYFTPC